MYINMSDDTNAIPSYSKNNLSFSFTYFTFRIKKIKGAKLTVLAFQLAVVWPLAGEILFYQERPRHFELLSFNNPVQLFSGLKFAETLRFR